MNTRGGRKKGRQEGEMEGKRDREREEEGGKREQEREGMRKEEGADERGKRMTTLGDLTSRRTTRSILLRILRTTYRGHKDRDSYCIDYCFLILPFSKLVDLGSVKTCFFTPTATIKLPYACISPPECRVYKDVICWTVER